MIHKDYRGMGFLSGVFRQSSQMSREFGFSSVLGRIAITARASLPTLREGGQLLGIIPKSVRISKFGWVSDLISYTDSTPRSSRKHIDLVSFLFCIIIRKCSRLFLNFFGSVNPFPSVYQLLYISTNAINKYICFTLRIRSLP